MVHHLENYMIKQLKETLIKKLGYNLVIIWEYDWKKINKSISILQRYIRCKIKKD